MVQMFITNLTLDAQRTRAVLLLGDAENRRVLPIVIGLFEAQAIVSQMREAKFSRPMTHDLLCNVIEETGYALARVRITRLEEGTFYASLDLESGTGTLEIDARPSDAIALALRTGASILVDEEVLREAEVPTEKAEDEEIETFKRLMNTMSDQVDASEVDVEGELGIGPDEDAAEAQED